MANVIALVPARGGSKGIAHKNIVPLAGQPLLHYSLLEALESGVFDEVIVSSDDEMILQYARDYPGVTPLARPQELAQDETPMDPVIADVIETQSLDNDDIVVLLQPTSPLRTRQHIRDALNQFQRGFASAVISVVQVDSKWLKTYLVENEQLQPIYSKEMHYQRRQDLPSLYAPNGAIYVFSVAGFKENGCIPRENLAPFFMQPEASLDIDTPEDLQRAENQLRTLS